MGRVLVPLRGLCVHPSGARSDPAWESWAPMMSGCDEGLGTHAQCGAVAAGSGLSPPLCWRVDIPAHQQTPKLGLGT